MTQKIKVQLKKLHPDSKVPTYAHEHDACCDLYYYGIPSVGFCLEPGGPPVSLSTGVIIETPVGYELQVRGRSGLSLKGISAAFGTIDAGYVGECKITLTNTTKEPWFIQHGDRIGQIAIKEVLQMDFQEVDNIESTTARGANGFGSSGR